MSLETTEQDICELNNKECPCNHCEEETSESEYDEDESCITDSSDDYDDENNTVLRGKWLFTGSDTIDDMIECLQKEIKLLTDLKRDGWYLTQQVDDDYAFIRRDVPSTQETTVSEETDGDDSKSV